MTYKEFKAKWGSIPTKHEPTCQVETVHEWAPCTCGQDALWAQRNADLATVDPKELPR